MRVEGAVAIVTGGAGGLGGGVVRMLAENGGYAAIVDLPSSPGKALAESLGERTIFIPTDVTDAEQVESAVASTVERFARIDLLVNAAGVSPAARVVNRAGAMFPLDTFKQTLDINLTGAFDILRHAAKAMTANAAGADGERGLIVNVSSIAAFEGQVGQAAYTASKGAIAALTITLARDLAAYGIRVMGVAPGIMDTPMLAGADQARRDGLIDLHLFPKRLGTPQDFAALVRCFMEVTLLNGEIVRLDAGTRMAG